MRYWMQAGDEPVRRGDSPASAYPVQHHDQPMGTIHAVDRETGEVACDYAGTLYVAEPPFTPDTFGGCPRCKAFVLTNQ